jgi:hypothetical protein
MPVACKLLRPNNVRCLLFCPKWTFRLGGQASDQNQDRTLILVGFFRTHLCLPLFVTGALYLFNPDCFDGVGCLHHDFRQVFSFSGPLVADI